MLLPLILSLHALSMQARADEVSLLAMQDYPLRGAEAISTESEPCADVLADTCSDFVTVGYQKLVLELGTAIGNKPSLPARTLGVNGFAFDIINTFAFIRTGTLDGVNPTGWDLASTDDEAFPLLMIPTLRFRKGLPFSLEAGLNVGWIAPTQTATVAGYGRWGLIEGWKQFPDVTLQIGYGGYVGNDELELSAFDSTITVGYDLAFGRTAMVNSSIFSPFLGVGIQRFHAAPRVDLSGTSLAGRLPEVSGWKSADDPATDTVAYNRQFAPLTLGGGFRILSGSFNFTASADYAFGSIATVHTGFGFVY